MLDLTPMDWEEQLAYTVVANSDRDQCLIVFIDQDKEDLICCAPKNHIGEHYWDAYPKIFHGKARLSI